MLRTGPFVFCEADSSSVNFEKVLIEFESEELAEEFEENVKNGVARIIFEEDERKEFWDDLDEELEMKKKFMQAQKSGDKARIGELLDELGNEYEIFGFDAPLPERSGIVRIALMEGHGVHAFGFKGREDVLRKWMLSNHFDPADLHHCQLNLYD